MTDTLAQAEALARGRFLSAPQVAPLVSVVRSGEQFMLIGGGAVPPGGLGNLVLEWGYEVAPLRRALFKTFLKELEGLLAQRPAALAGVLYRGTYAVFQQTELSLGGFRTIWSFDSLDKMQEMGRAVAAVPLPAVIDETAIKAARWSWEETVKVLMDFRDPEYAAGRSQVMLQPAATAPAF